MESSPRCDTCPPTGHLQSFKWWGQPGLCLLSLSPFRELFQHLFLLIFCTGFGVQFSGWTIMYWHGAPLNISSIPIGAIHSYHSIIDYIPYALLTALWLFCNCQFVLLNLFTSCIQSPKPFPLAATSFLCVYESVSIFFVHLFSSLDSTYEWNHIVLVFLRLTYFTEYNNTF